MCENCQGQICKAFISLTIGAKMIGGGRPLLPVILSQSDRVGAKFEQAGTPKRYQIGCQLLLITNRKSQKGFPLVPTSMTLNDLEHVRNSPYFAFFTEFDRFSGRLYHSG